MGRYIPMCASLEAMQTVTAATVSQAESALGMKFTPEFKTFLMNPPEEVEGAACEVVGLTSSSGYLNVVDSTLECRNSESQYPLPDNCAVFAWVGNGDAYFYNMATKRVGVFLHAGPAEVKASEFKNFNDAIQKLFLTA